MADIGWVDGNRLVGELGRERWLADRIEVERKKRGWSQAKLSHELAAISRPISQPAISGIETSSPGKGRRSISTDEAIAFARVFDVPLGELLLPPGATEQAQFLSLASNGPDVQRKIEEAVDEYENHLRSMTTLIRGDQAIRAVYDRMSQDFWSGPNWYTPEEVQVLVDNGAEDPSFLFWRDLNDILNEEDMIGSLREGTTSYE